MALQVSGVAAFDTGGFIVDGGHRYPEQKASFLPSSAVGDIPPPPILMRYPFPELPLLIVMPSCSRIYGDAEVELFRTLCPQPEWVAQKLSHILLLQILPALIEGDMSNLGEALNDIQTFGWKRVEIDAQGPELQLTLDYLNDSGAFGAGVSSWGPAICVIAEDISRLKQETDAFLKTLPKRWDLFYYTGKQPWRKHCGKLKQKWADRSIRPSVLTFNLCSGNNTDYPQQRDQSYQLHA